MPPIVKDSDTLATPETSSRPGSAGDSATRPQPVALEVPITVNGARTPDGSDKREPFSESTKTVMVHGNGAVIKLHSALAPGQLLFLTNERTKKEVVCQVVKSKNYRNVSGYVELEFTEPAVGFWGMRFPGDRIAPGPQAAPEASRPVASNGSSLPTQPVEQKVEQPAASSTAERPSTPAPFLPKPETPARSESSIVPAPIDSGTLLGTAYPRPDGVSAARVTTLFGREERLVEPWLKKRDPASRVLEPAPSVARPEPVTKTEPSQPPVRDFQLTRPSDKPASLFAPSEPPSNPATVDLSSLAPFFEVKPSAADIAPAAPQAPASDPETEELRRHTTRLEEELSQMRFAEPASSLPAKPAPEAPPISEPAISLPKAEPVHESAAQLLEHPVASSAPAVLPEPRKLEEPLKIEPPASIPALESLEEGELKIPAWLAPLARNASAPSSPKELVLREKAKRIAEQPPLEELMAPLAAPLQQENAAASHAPRLRSARPLESVQKINESAPKKPGQGMLFVALGAGILLLGAGGWWYKNEHSGGVQAGTSTAQAKAPGATSQDVQANSSNEAALGAMLPVDKDEATASATPDAGSANVPGNAAPAGATDAAGRNPRSASNSANGGSAVIIAETAEPGAAPTEKKPVLGEVHLEAPKISPKRTAESSSEPDARAMSEEPQEGNTNALGVELASNKPPAPPAAPVAVGGEVRQARLVSTVPPEYPSLARAQHVSGGVTIDALIDANGRVTKMKVLSGPTLLEQAAMDALRQWRYEPAMLDGKAVPMHLTVTIQFRLQ